MKQLRLGIIIVSWNVKELLDKCLSSLADAFLEKSFISLTSALPTVTVVDNASADGSAEMVRTKHPWVQLLARTENLGYVKANNIGITNLLTGAHLRPEYIWLLNPDTVVHRTTITKLLSFMETHPEAGLIGPQLLNPDGSRQDSAFRFPGILQPLFDFGLLPQRFYFTALNGRYADKAYNAKIPFQVDHPLGAGMLARSTAIDEVGLLDEAFFMYCEEIDWAWRMRKLGWESWIVPDATITHYGGASTSQNKPATTAHLWESRARLYRKHRHKMVFLLVAYIVTTHFYRQNAATPAWQDTHQRIIKAWKNPTDTFQQGKLQ